jgi:hypothetical protein
MASLTDLYSSTPELGFSDSYTNEADVREDAGIQKERLLKAYSSRALPQLVDRFASRGTFMSGHAGVALSQLGEDVGNQYGDVDRMMARQLSALARNRVLAAAGLSV